MIRVRRVERRTKRSSASDPYAAALRLLTRRGYAEGELSRRLQGKGYSAEEISAALNRCRELGYLDDQHFATQRALALVRNGRAVGWRARLDLRQRGIDEELTGVSVAAAEAEHPPLELLRRDFTRRYPNFDYHSADLSGRRRVIQYFLRRGFELSLVLDFLQTTKDELP